MKDFFDFFRARRELPGGSRIAAITRSFSTTGRFILGILVAGAVASTIAILAEINDLLLITVPAVGGSHTEGIVGTPRFINPILAISDADRDVTALVFSGLLRALPDGSLVPDLAEHFEVSPDGLSYTVVIRDDARFHDGVAVTADDVLFTIAKAQDPAVKSPKRANWDGVAVAALDPRTVRFTLKAPYSPFLENLTIGILPKGRWGALGSEELPFSELNTEPIGNGPYALETLVRDTSGIPTEYRLKRNRDFAPGSPFLERLAFRFYKSEDELLRAYQRGEVEAIHSISPARAKELAPDSLAHVALPRIFGVFLNQNQLPSFTEKAVRDALSASAPRYEIVEEVLRGFGAVVESPIPPTLSPEEPGAPMSDKERIAAARVLLEKAGWKKNEESGVYEKKSKGKTTTLSFTLATANVPELRATAEILKGAWGAVGIRVEVNIFEQGDLSQLVIRPRKYDALLFGEVVGRELDLFAFWHSSQRNDPGLNIALYANSKVDKLLEEIRRDEDAKARLEKARAAAAEIERDTPAIFLYAPDFIYALPEDLEGVTLGTVTTPAERFLSVREWYTETDRIWNIFTKRLFSSL